MEEKLVSMIHPWTSATCQLSLTKPSEWLSSGMTHRNQDVDCVRWYPSACLIFNSCIYFPLTLSFTNAEKSMVFSLSNCWSHLALFSLSLATKMSYNLLDRIHGLCGFLWEFHLYPSLHYHAVETSDDAFLRTSSVSVSLPLLSPSLSV